MPEARLQRTRDAYQEPVRLNMDDVLRELESEVVDRYETITDGLGHTTRVRIPQQFTVQPW